MRRLDTVEAIRGGMRMSKEYADISVIMPAYDAERSVERAIQSVLDQTLQPREIIVIDDGSADSTGEVLARFAGRVRCIRQDNAGPSAARNRGIDEARAEWIAFLDADDVWLPDRLTKCHEILRRHPDLVWSCAACRKIWPDGTKEKLDPGRWKHLWNPDHQTMNFLKGSVLRVPFNTCGMLIRRDVLLQAGKFPAGISRGEDIQLWYKIAVTHPTIGFVWPPQVLYMQTTNSLTRASDEDHFRLMQGFLRRCTPFRDQADPSVLEDFTDLLRLHVILAWSHCLQTTRRDSLKELMKEFGWLLSGRQRLWVGLSLLAPPGLLARTLRWARKRRAGSNRRID